MFKRGAISVSTAIACALTGNAFADEALSKNSAVTNAGSSQMVEVSASDLQALKAQIQALTQKVNQLEANQQQQQAHQMRHSEALDTHTHDKDTHEHTLTTDDLTTRTFKTDDQDQKEDDSNKPQPLFRGEHVYIQSDAEYDDTLLEQLSSSQLPLGVLKLKDRFADPSLVLGGSLEADVQGWWGDQIRTGGKDIYGNGAGAYITTANLDVVANVNKWVQGYMTIAGDENSVSIENAFITFGDLNEFPFFASVGKNRAPLGSFGGGGVWASSIGTMLFRPTQVTNVTVGYNYDDLTTYLTGWRSSGDDTTSTVNEYNFVYSAFYTDNITDKLAYGVNAGYMNNIIGSGSGADGVGGSSDRNPVLNLEGSLTYEAFGLYSGITSTLFKREYSDYERAGTWYVQGAYSPEIYEIPTTFTLSYNGAYHTENFSGTVNGDAINGIQVTGPKNEIIAYVQSEVFKNVYLTLEYAWLNTYNNGKGNTVTGDATVYF